MEMVSGFGTMNKFTKVNGNWEQKMDMAFGSLQKEINMKANGC